MKRFWLTAAAAVFATGSIGFDRLAHAQPAKGAPAAFERVREVMSSRVKDMKLVGDPDKDFAAMLAAHQENLVFLAKTQLEYGGDRQLREMAQRISDEGQKHIDSLKQWQVRSRESDYRAQPNQSPPGSGPLDRRAQAQPAPNAPAQPGPQAAQPTPSAQPAPFVSGRIEDLDSTQGKITIEHNAIPNLSMDAMTMVFRVADSAMLKAVKKGDKVQFTAERVNGQLTVTKLQKGR